jgi:DNA invertase Pin-like site-specific DNA recombinase
MDRPTTAILYTRVSTQEQGRSRNGLEGQLTALQAFCQKEGITPLMHLEEVASGGLGFEGRPILAKAFELARKVKACVLVSKLDRLSREVQLVATLMNGKVDFYTAEDGLDCPPTVLHMRATFGEDERRRGGERTRAALQAKKARGEPLGRHCHRDPGGTLAKAIAASNATNKAKADAWAQQVAPTVLTLYRAGKGMQQVAQTLNAMRVPTSGGGVWHASTVCRVLKRAGL